MPTIAVAYFIPASKYPRGPIGRPAAKGETEADQGTDDSVLTLPRWALTRDSVGKTEMVARQ
jgi:hypothetical protein